MTKSMARMLGSISTIPLMLVLTSCGAKPPSPTTTTVPGIGPLPAIAATVDGKTISTTAVVNQSFVDGGAAALGQLIDYEVLDQAAAKQNIVVTQSDIDAQFQQLANGSGRSGMGGGAL